MKGRAASERDILKRLSAGLSKEEIQHVLAEALSSLDPAGVKRLLQQVGPETSAALRGVLDADDSKRPPVPGIAKIKEEWDRAWEDWNARIAEACDQEGDYVMQEHHWEQPISILYPSPMTWSRSRPGCGSSCLACSMRTSTRI